MVTIRSNLLSPQFLPAVKFILFRLYAQIPLLKFFSTPVTPAHVRDPTRS